VHLKALKSLRLLIYQRNVFICNYNKKAYSIILYLRGEIYNMFKELTQFYRIGKELGLKKSEINRTFLFSGNRSILFTLSLIFFLASLAVVIVVAIVVGSKSVYPSGTLYSSVKLNDFKNKK